MEKNENQFWTFAIICIWARMMLTRISFWRAVEPALRNNPSTPTLSKIRWLASTTNRGTSHTLPDTSATSAKSKLLNGLWKIRCVPHI